MALAGKPPTRHSVGSMAAGRLDDWCADKLSNKAKCARADLNVYTCTQNG